MKDTLKKKEFMPHFWARNENSIWLSSSLKLHRNLRTHHFPHKLEPKFLTDLTKMLAHPLKKCSRLKKGLFYLMKELSNDDKQFLSEYYPVAHNYTSFHGAEGLYISSNHHIHVLINTSDHLILNIVDSNLHLEEAYNQLLHIEEELSKEIEFAFSPKFGFLTSNLKNCGTALRIDLVLHLPALSYAKSLQEVLEQTLPQSVSYRSIENKSEHFLGDLVIISNKQTLGISEEQIIKSMHSCALNIIIAEKKAREQMLTEGFEIKNEISKSLGTLKHALKMNAREGLQGLSLCKLAVELGWLNHCAHKNINELFFSIQKGILNVHFKPGEDIMQLRAKQIQSILKPATL